MRNTFQNYSKNYFIISENEKSEFFDTYKSLVKDFKFSGPQTVDLEYSSCLERNYADYYNTVNIRKNYSVTDKVSMVKKKKLIGSLQKVVNAI